jgi:DNA polymerase III subunit delta
VTPSELNQELESGKFRSVYYFYGTEDYRMKEAEKAIVRIFLPKSQKAINHTVITAQKGRLPDILTELSVIPMLGERQVFTIDEIQSLSQNEIEKILSILSPPDPSRMVIFVTPASRALNKKTKLLEFLLKKTAAIEFNRIPGDQARRRITAIFKEHQITIEPEAEKILIMLGGGDMGGLTEEVNKLVNYVGQGGTITKEDVALVCSDYQAYQIYELADRVAQGDFDRSLAVISYLTGQGERASTITFWLGEHFIDLYLVKNKKPLPVWKRNVLWKYNQQADLFDNKQLEKIIELISEADFELRNNIKPETLIVEKLVINICNLRNQKTAHG